jgi:hypothetical protein
VGGSTCPRRHSPTKSRCFRTWRRFRRSRLKSKQILRGGVDNYIKFAKAAKDDALVERIASTAMEVQAKAIGQGVNSTLDPRWAAPAIAEAWCYATISLSKGYLHRLHAEAIIAAIEAFTSSRS